MKSKGSRRRQTSLLRQSLINSYHIRCEMSSCPLSNNTIEFLIKNLINSLEPITRSTLDFPGRAKYLELMARLTDTEDVLLGQLVETARKPSLAGAAPVTMPDLEEYLIEVRHSMNRLKRLDPKSPIGAIIGPIIKPFVDAIVNTSSDESFGSSDESSERLGQ